MHRHRRATRIATIAGATGWLYLQHIKAAGSDIAHPQALRVRVLIAGLHDYHWHASKSLGKVHAGCAVATRGDPAGPNLRTDCGGQCYRTHLQTCIAGDKSLIRTNRGTTGVAGADAKVVSAATAQASNYRRHALCASAGQGGGRSAHCAAIGDGGAVFKHDRGTLVIRVNRGIERRRACRDWPSRQCAGGGRRQNTKNRDDIVAGSTHNEVLAHRVKRIKHVAICCATQHTVACTYLTHRSATTQTIGDRT